MELELRMQESGLFCECTWRGVYVKQSFGYHGRQYVSDEGL